MTADSPVKDAYTTIAAPSRAELKVLGSRFIAFAHPVSGKEAVEDVLSGVRREYHDATHHCFAYRLGASGDEYRAVDGGEPSGSAGRPILAAIDRASLTDVLVVVARYFGGTKLGVGGLARAYGEAASGALTSAATKVCYTLVRLRASFPHQLVGAVMHAAGRAGATIETAEYDEEVHLVLNVRASRANELEASLVEGTRGGVRLTREARPDGAPPAGPSAL